MKRFSLGHTCPLCNQAFRFRIRRKWYMRLVPGSRHYVCDYCGYRSVSLFKKVSLRLFRMPLNRVKSLIDKSLPATHAPLDEN